MFAANAVSGHGFPRPLLVGKTDKPQILKMRPRHGLDLKPRRYRALTTYGAGAN
jgi:hypothetical protein